MISYLSKTGFTVWNSLWSLAGWKKAEKAEEEEKKVESNEEKGEDDEVKSHPLEE